MLLNLLVIRSSHKIGRRMAKVQIASYLTRWVHVDPTMRDVHGINQQINPTS